MKFVIEPIINDLPGGYDVFKKKYKKNLLASLVHKRSHWTHTRTRLAEAQNWKCCFCGVYMTEHHGKKNSVTVEHVLAQSKGGSDDPSNLAASCSRCNGNRGNVDIEYFLANKVKGQSSAQVKLKAKIRKYVKKAQRLAEIGFLVNEEIRSFDDWFKTLKLPQKGKELFFAEFNPLT